MAIAYENGLLGITDLCMFYLSYPQPSPLFQKIDASFGDKMKAKFAGKRKPASEV